MHRHEVESLVDLCIWALFESCRAGDNPGDPKAFARVMDRINAEAPKRCHQRERVPATVTGGNAEESKR